VLVGVNAFGLSISRLSQEDWMLGRLLRLLSLVALPLAACSDSTGPAARCEGGPYLTHLPVEQSLIQEVSILGQFNPPGDIFPRGQTSLALNGSGLTPLYAPARSTILSVRSTTWSGSEFRADTTDYSISFEIDACPQIEGVFHHIPALTSALMARLADATCETYSTTSESVVSCTAFVRIPTDAGAVLGQATASHGFDFDFFDKRVTYDYVMRRRYPGAQWAICVQPLYPPPLRDFLLERVGRGGVRRTHEPVCGRMEIDVAGTAQGMWVVEGHDVVMDFATSHLFFALAYDDLSDDFLVIATGHPAFRLNAYSPLYTFHAESEGRVNRRFVDLPADGTIHCYTPGPGVPGGLPSIVSIFVALGAEGRVTIEKVEHALHQSPCALQAPAAWAFSSAALHLMR
jgi:hypothetical protein